MLKMLLFVAMGGALGAMARYMTVRWVGHLLGTGFPYGTLTVNILGSFILGALVEAFALKWHVSQELRAMIVVGVLGAFTTFSSFSLDAVLQLERGHLGSAGIYILSSVTFSVLGLFAGLRLVRLVMT
jgi:fluoride exporter